LAVLASSIDQNQPFGPAGSISAHKLHDQASSMAEQIAEFMTI
jgi:hypothetical protein